MDSTTLNLIGILTSIAGTWLFGWDVIWGFKKRNKASLFKIQLEGLISTYEYVKGINNRLTNFSEEEIQEEQNKNNEKYLPQIDKIRKEIIKSEDTASTAAFLAVFGLFITTIGCLLQIAALYINGPVKIFKKDNPATKSDSTFILRDINFDSNSYCLNHLSYHKLDSLAAILTVFPKRKIEVSAYTDNIGTNNNNLALSNKRAVYIREYLLSKNIYPNRIKIKAYGEEMPIAPNDTDSGRQLNRRVEFRYIY